MITMVRIEEKPEKKKMTDAEKRAYSDALEAQAQVMVKFQLPALPSLSLDPTNRAERAFSRAEIDLQVIRTRREALDSGMPPRN